MYAIYQCKNQVVIVNLAQALRLGDGFCLTAYNDVEIVEYHETLDRLIASLGSVLHDRTKPAHLKHFSQGSLNKIFKRVSPKRLTSIC